MGVLLHTVIRSSDVEDKTLDGSTIRRARAASPLSPDRWPSVRNMLVLLNRALDTVQHLNISGPEHLSKGMHRRSVPRSSDVEEKHILNP